MGGFCPGVLSGGLCPDTKRIRCHPSYFVQFENEGDVAISAEI